LPGRFPRPRAQSCQAISFVVIVRRKNWRN
jgi:hypothetical protein